MLCSCNLNVKCFWFCKYDFIPKTWLVKGEAGHVCPSAVWLQCRHDYLHLPLLWNIRRDRLSRLHAVESNTPGSQDCLQEMACQTGTSHLPSSRKHPSLGDVYVQRDCTWRQTSCDRMFHNAALHEGLFLWGELSSRHNCSDVRDARRSCFYFLLWSTGSWNLFCFSVDWRREHIKTFGLLCIRHNHAVTHNKC